MKLYQNPLSPNTRKAVVAAALLGIDLEMVLVDLRTGANQKPEYLAINPMGKVPTLVDGDLVLWESHAIMQHLADKKPGNTLYPQSAAPRANVNRWLFWSSTHFSPAAAMIVNERVIKAMRGQPEDPAISAYGEREMARFGKVLDDQLGKHTYVAGPVLTLADIAIAAPLMYAEPAKLPVGGFANVGRWFGKIRELDAWKKSGPQS